MNRVILVVMAVLAVASVAQAKNYVYGDSGSSLESAGYKLFVSDKIVDTVDKVDKATDKDAGYCSSVDENTSKSLGNISTIRSDNRLEFAADTKLSYSAACATFYSLVERLKTADDIRRLWLLFGDSATDDYVVKTLKERGTTEDSSVLIEMKRLAVVSKYIEYFTKNKDWKLTDYTFLSQAFKARKDMALSPAYSQFIEALLTGDTEKALQVVKSIDLDNLGNRFIPPGASDGKKAKGADLRN